MDLKQTLIRSCAEECGAARAVDSVIDEMLARSERRHAWLSEAAEKIRQWREEDARNGQPWGEPSTIESTKREAGVANNAPGSV